MWNIWTYTFDVMICGDSDLNINSVAMNFIID